MLTVRGQEALEETALAYRAKLDALHALWLSRRVENSLPVWTDFRPRDLKTWLANIALIERVPETGRFKVRLMGMACVDVSGRDNTGRYIDECTEHHARKELIRSYGQCLEEQTPLLRCVEYNKGDAMRTIVHRIYLPCLDQQGQANLIMMGVYGVETQANLSASLDLGAKALIEEKATIRLL